MGLGYWQAVPYRKRQPTTRLCSLQNEARRWIEEEADPTELGDGQQKKKCVLAHFIQVIRAQQH